MSLNFYENGSSSFPVLILGETLVTNSVARQGKSEEKPKKGLFEIHKSTALEASEIPGIENQSKSVEKDIESPAFDTTRDIKSDIINNEADIAKADKDLDPNRTKGGIQVAKLQEKISIRVEVPESSDRDNVNRTEPTTEAHEKRQQEAVEHHNYLKQSNRRVQPNSSTTSQNSSIQASPLAPRKTNLPSSSDPPSDYEILGEDVLSFSLKRKAELRSGIAEVCSCSSESWAEIMIRRSTGNTSWVMKLENALDSERDFGGVEDIASLAAAMEIEDFSYGYRMIL